MLARENYLSRDLPVAIFKYKLDAKVVLAYKAYDTNELRGWLEAREIKAVIPPKSNRNDDIECDFCYYKERHTVECMFGKLKYYRRIAMRYEKKAINYRECYV